MLEKCYPDQSYGKNERPVMEQYERCEIANRAYIELPSFGYMGDEALTKREAERIACGAGKAIVEDKERGINHFEYNKYRAGKKEIVKVAYESLNGIKAKLDLVGKLGFMGVTFDIMHIPTEYVMLFTSMFRSATTDQGAT